MDFNDTPEEAKFRKEAYDWLKDNAPLKEGPKDSWRASSEEEGLKEVKKWQKKLAWFQKVARRWLPTTGAVYCLTIIKRREGMKLLKSDVWKSKAKFGKKTVPSVSTFK